MLAEPRTRLGLGLGGLLGTVIAVRRDRVGPREARVFLAVNGLTDALYPAAWVVMQAGAFGAVPAASASAWLTGDRLLASRLLAGGTAAWALSKVVKQAVRRPSRRHWYPEPAAAAVMPLGSDTCPGTLPWPSPWVPPLSPTWGRPAAVSR